jgi:ribonuclease D
MVAFVSAAPYLWIDTEDGLAGAAGALGGARALAIDTEADSFYHYFHKCCLIQVSDGETTCVIDPLAIRRLGPLGELLASRSIVKVLHAAEQDVLYLRRDCGFEVTPLFDTMIAAQLLGKPSIGLAGLLEACFKVTLDKGCQRDDWSRRPLTERQKAYAAEDVRHLIRLADILKADLEAKGRLEWAMEEFDLVTRRAWEPRAFDRDGFWGIKGSRDLAARQAAVLRELYVTRDARARAGDLPPFRIISDQALLSVAAGCPGSLDDLKGVKGITPLVRQRIGPLLLEAVRRGLAVRDADLPVPTRGRGQRQSAAARERLERLREWRRVLAAELALDPGVLCPQSTLEALAAAGTAALDRPEGIPGLRAWRRGLLAPAAAKLLA